MIHLVISFSFNNKYFRSRFAIQSRKKKKLNRKQFYMWCREIFGVKKDVVNGQTGWTGETKDICRTQRQNRRQRVLSDSTCHEDEPFKIRVKCVLGACGMSNGQSCVHSASQISHYEHFYYYCYDGWLVCRTVYLWSFVFYRFEDYGLHDTLSAISMHRINALREHNLIGAKMVCVLHTDRFVDLLASVFLFASFPSMAHTRVLRKVEMKNSEILQFVVWQVYGGNVMSFATSGSTSGNV